MSLPNGIDPISRRRFLTLLSASASLALGSSCSRIDRGTIVPYTRRPGESIPGVATYYASTFQEGLTTLGVLVKTREGRPINIEGNAEHAVSRGKTGLRAMGDLLGLYDPDRLRTPSHRGGASSWDDAINSMAKALSDARLLEKPILLLTGAMLSPTQKALLYDLRLAFPTLLHAAWEPYTPTSGIAASAALYGNAVLPRLHLDRADVILSLQSDFLGRDPNASVFTQDFASRRIVSGPKASMNRLWVLEGGMTITGANADQRIAVRPSKIAELAVAVARQLHQAHSLPLPAGLKAEDLGRVEVESAARNAGIDPSILRLLAENLAGAKSASLVLAGPELPTEAHVACGLLNSMLGAEGNTLDTNSASQSPALINLPELQSLLKEAAQGKYAVGIFWGANPAYAFPDASLWKSAIAKIPESYRIGLYEDETALDCAWRLPENHWLESWGDFDPVADYSSLRQPVIGTIHDSRQGEDILVACLRKMKIQGPRSYLEYLKSRWQSEVCPADSPVPFETFWNAALHDGGVRREPKPQSLPAMNIEAVRNALSAVGNAGTQSTGFEIALAPGSAVYDGRYANNGWLNELPDPVTKATWGNPLLLSATDAERLGVREHDAVRITAGGKSVEVSVLIQPGQASGVASLALGYGRRTGSVAIDVGANAYSLMDVASKTPYLLSDAKLARVSADKRKLSPRTQDFDQQGSRDLARSWSLTQYSAEVSKETHGHSAEALPSLIPNPEFPNQKWGMVIDLSACTGCSACMIACQSENNIPVVGPDRIAVGRGMHWIRIDRYYEGDARNPKVQLMPMLCQHCDNAPCEIVCPVNATTHSPDGLNQMAYNRCVGTRYCSNNCPFKVRRFNFFDYTSMKKEPESLVFNPEVTVRPRGVMEKCTFCIQRIQNAKQNAKSESRQIRDGEIQPACVAACPANAMVFGNVNDPQSRVSRLMKMNRKYRLLEDLGIRPSVTYLVDISNPAIKKDKA